SKNLSRNQALSSNPKLLEAKDFNSRIVINENLYLTYQQDENLEKLEKILGIESGRLLVLHDDDALYAVERSLFRITRVRLERESKKVSTGPWTEEYIPRGTLFYSVLLYSKPYGKVEAKNTKASEIRSKLRSFLKETEHYLIIGGNETIGKGIVKLIFLW
ncbi:MAG: type III-B CRISPR module RAMP protein Cmr4, partial [Candidatus Baldrarchaeia archaeon]